MATSDKREQSGVPVGVVLALVVATVGFLWSPWHLESPRPASTASPSVPPSHLQDVAARLWQDPFSAVERHRDSHSSSVRIPIIDGTARIDRSSILKGLDLSTARDEDGRLETLQDTLSGQQTRPKVVGRAQSQVPVTLHVLGVMLLGGNYPENIEQRRRVRYAVLSGLSVVGFIPEREDALGYFDATPMFRYARRHLQHVPFEFFISGDGARADGLDHRVLILWLDEEALDDEFARAQLRTLFTCLRSPKGAAPPNATWVSLDRVSSSAWKSSDAARRDPREGDCPQAASTTPKSRTIAASDGDATPGDAPPPSMGRHVVLGPSSSRLLKVMELQSRNDRKREEERERAEAQAASGKSGKDRGPQIEFLSTATVNVSQFLDFRRAEIPRIVSTDDRLMSMLVAELKRRRVDVDHSRGRDDLVALVSEWDSLYGRSLSEFFERAACGEAAQCQTPSRRERHVARFSYLRGLDGLPVAAAPAAAPKAVGAKNGANAPEAEAFGDSHVDYLHRLAGHMHDFERTYRGTFGTGEIKAIGILGNDIYDKILVLKALRQEFPKAIFFTTDFDARYLNPSEQGWTRNLLVASSYGLTLDRARQGGVPPFRDSYQTATFLATQLAFERPSRSSVDPLGRSQNRLDAMIQPRLFEIGRGVAVDLSNDGRSITDPRCDTLDNCTNVHPAPAPMLPLPSFATAMSVGLALISGLALVWLGSARVRQRVAWMIGWWNPWDRWRVAAACVIAGFLGLPVAAFVSALLDGPDGEPFRLVDGVSVWPTEILRYVAAVFSLYFLVRIRHSFRHVEYELNKVVPGFDPLPVPRPQSGVVAWITAIPTAMRGPDADSTFSSSHDAEDLWDSYARHSTLYRQCQRVVPAGILLYFFCLTIVSFDPPSRPTRGAAAAWVDPVVLFFVAVPLFIWVLLSATDTIWLGHTFARSLGAPDLTKWPAATIEVVTRRVGMSAHRSEESPESSRSLEDRRIDAVHRRLSDRCVSHWLDLEVIARWTRIVNPIIYYPFIVLCLLILARNPLFDNWPISYPLFAVFALCGLYAVAAAFMLRGTAERARQCAIDRLLQLLMESKGDRDLATLTSQIEMLLERVRNLREGAFGPFTDQPVVRAILLPILTFAAPLILSRLPLPF